MRLFSQIKISGIMKKLGFYKEKGIQPVSMMLQFLMSLMTTTSILKFMARGGTSNNDERYSRSVLYRFLGNPSYNWRALQMSIAIILSKKISALTKNRRKCLIVDDSLYDRGRSRHTQMLSRVYDYVTQSYSLGFQYLNLCWTDGNTTLPCDFAMAGAARQKECKRKKDRKRKSSNLINPGLMRLPGCQEAPPS
ncbi:transposase [Succinimonas amylolytica]|uniref:transposase n=1 Tax=Succinimonas amylolytica TaxID=83769 RepID=UPI0012F78928|nr:transposase [Succinimonas amylolytica]